MHSLIIISTTFERKEDGEKIAEILLAENLIGCAQLSGPVQSHYRWQGKTEISVEYLLQLKTAESKYSLVEKRIKELHPYDLPEIVAVPVSHCSNEYLNWVVGETGG
ncbi:divalent-cation tolerance protein CutA [Desulfomarina sp.]